MLLYLIRHGESETNRTGCYTGWMQVSLTENGFKDAEGIRNFLQKVPFDKVYSSDLLRARQTAETALPGCEYEQTPLLREINLGDLCGKNLAQCREEYGESFAQCRKDRNFVPYGGENDEMITERAQKFLNIVAQSGHECVAAFSHGGLLKTMVRYVLQMKIPFAVLQCPNCTIAVFEFINGMWKLDGWIDPKLLRE